MQILSQNELKNYEKMTNEELIISILKSKQSVAKFFNNNNNNNNNNDLYDNKISDIRRILNRLRDILLENIESKLKKSSMK